MIIDFHTHVFPGEVLKNRESYLSDEGFNILYSDKKSKIITAENLIQYMCEYNVNKSIALGFSWSDEHLCDEHNSYLLEIKNKYNDKIIPMAAVPVNDNIDYDNYFKKIKGSGFIGVGEVSFYSVKDEEKINNILNNIFKYCDKYKLALCLHLNEPVGHKYNGKYETSFSFIYNLVKTYPDLIIIASHWGGGIIFYELMPEVKRDFKNVFYDISASPYIYDNKIYNLIDLLNIKEKILFGSDYPLLKIERYTNEMKDIISDELISRITSYNGNNLLNRIIEFNKTC